LPHRAFRFGNRRLDRWRCIAIETALDAHVFQNLGRQREFAAEVTERAAGLAQRGEHLQGRNDAVAGGMAFQAQQMA